MNGEHYFSAQPESDAQYRDLSVILNGTPRTLTTAHGIFSPGRIDQGTEVLLKHMTPASPEGHILDLGSGWGPISLTLAERSPNATIWAVDVNSRALELVKRNAQRIGVNNIRVVTPDGVPGDIQFRSIRSNPPIRIGKNELHSMLSQWLLRLAPGGDAQLVVQKNLGSDSLLRWLREELPKEFLSDRMTNQKGFRILRVRREADDIRHGFENG